MTDRLYTKYPQDNSMYVFTFNGDWFYLLPNVDGKYEQKSTGTWECKGNNNFIITTEKHTWSSDGGGWVERPSVEDESDVNNSVFACILKNKNVRGPVATVSSDGNSVSFFVDEPNKVSHIFYKDKKWVQSKDGVNEFTGKWNCDGDHHFFIFTDDESYSSRSDNWATIDRDTFPLKYGSKGPNVVKLQKFLNSKLPNNPLTVNGIFDTQTENKLIEYQRKEGLIK